LVSVGHQTLGLVGGMDRKTRYVEEGTELKMQAQNCMVKYTPPRHPCAFSVGASDLGRSLVLQTSLSS
jgi:hypothetical protein